MKNKYYIIILVALTLLFGVWFVYQNGFVPEEISVYEPISETYVQTVEEETEPSSFKVYITGQIKNPGVYDACNGNRIVDIVNKAGGFTENADKEKINLAEYVEDEQHIEIQSIVKEVDKTLNSGQNINDGSESDNSKNSNGLININTASQKELETLPSIGEVTAANIIEYREKNGGFSNISEIKKVSRIGDKIFERIKDLITV